MGSSNTDRDLDFKTNGESDVDIISNPSQSSIEVLDQYAGRKNYDERRTISHAPNLETIDDQSYTQTFLEREFDNMINYANKDKIKTENRSQTEQVLSSTMATISTNKKATAAMVHNNLTESSSSGSVTDSVCTAYEQKAENQSQNKTSEFLQQERNGKQPNVPTSNKKEENSGLSSIFGGKFIIKVNILFAKLNYCYNFKLQLLCNPPIF